MNRRAWILASVLLLLLLAGCAHVSVPAASPAQTSAPSPAPTATPVPLEGVWAAEIDGLRLTLTLDADGRFNAVAEETAGTIRTARVEGTYSEENGQLHFESEEGDYRCAAEWTATELTVLQEGFAPLLLTRTEGMP